MIQRVNQRVEEQGLRHQSKSNEHMNIPTAPLFTHVIVSRVKLALALIHQAHTVTVSVNQLKGLTCCFYHFRANRLT